MLAVGIGLFAWLIHETGAHAIWQDVRRLGLGVIPFFLVDAVADVFHTFATGLAFRRDHRTVPFGTLYKIRLSGSAINYVTPTGNSGEVVKAALLGRFCPLTEATSAILVEKLSFTVAQLGLACLGSSVLLLWVPLAPWIAAMLCGGSLLVGAGLVGFFIFQRRGKIGAVIRSVCGFFAGERGRRWVETRISGLDESLMQYHAVHGRDFLASIGLHLLGFCCGMLQAAWFLWLLDGRSHLYHGAAIWLLSTWFDMASFLVPAGIGIHEVSRYFAFQLLGLPQASGVSFALLQRLEGLAYTALGFVCYGWEVRRPAPVVRDARE